MPASPNPLRLLNAAGQSVWYDHIHRTLLATGELARLIAEDDLRGITSNPSIFEKAIGSGTAYDDSLHRHLQAAPGASTRDLFYSLAVADIRAAADLLAPVYAATQGVDGMVSLEVSPDLADDTEATLAEARELHVRLDRPNVMIKIPGTRAGIPAIEQLTSEGININVTLLFAVDRYLEVADAWLRGLERRLEQQLPIDCIASVASFFVSRLDTLLDPVLAERRPPLQGAIAVANARRAYRRFEELRRSERWQRLATAGARPQRLLWASTSTKNPAYSDLLYVETLIGPDTVNTMPPATYAAFRDHGTVARTLDRDRDRAEAQLASLAEAGIDLDQATTRLETEGVAAFTHSFTQLLAVLADKARQLRPCP